MPGHPLVQRLHEGRGNRAPLIHPNWLRPAGSAIDGYSIEITAKAGVRRKYGLSLGNLIGSAGPDRFVATLEAALAPDRGPVRLHFYPFGGLAHTLDWVDGYARASGMEPTA